MVKSNGLRQKQTISPIMNGFYKAETEHYPDARFQGRESVRVPLLLNQTIFEM